MFELYSLAKLFFLGNSRSTKPFPGTVTYVCRFFVVRLMLTQIEYNHQNKPFYCVLCSHWISHKNDTINRFPVYYVHTGLVTEMIEIIGLYYLKLKERYRNICKGFNEILCIDTTGRFITK